MSVTDPPDEVFDTGLFPEDLDPERPRFLPTPWGELALYVLTDRIVAASAFCPHLLGPLFQGTRSGDRITCPWHRWSFSLTTGERTDAETRDRIQVLPTRIGPTGSVVLDPPGP